MKKVSAIIPCYNEGKRISEVLKTLMQVDLLHEIIVIDDGSTDDTAEKVHALKDPRIIYLRNAKNSGKAIAMERGVQMSKGEILFFCDADLRGLTPNVVEEIITPILNEKTDMFIGIRANKAQRLTLQISLLSGERALKRELWDKLPAYYKKKFRIEIGLNKYVQHYGRGYQYKKFDNYFQTLKEVKYGFAEGFKRRMLMYWDVYIAYLTFQLFHVPEARKKRRLSIMELVLSVFTIGFSVFLIGLGTRFGYSYIVDRIEHSLQKDPDGNFLKVSLELIKGVTFDTFEILGIGLLSSGVLLLILNIITLIKLSKAKKEC